MPDRNETASEDADNGVLESVTGVETTGIGIVDGATAQIDVALPVAVDDDDFDDDVVLDDDAEIHGSLVERPDAAAASALVVDAVEEVDAVEHVEDVEDVEETHGAGVADAAAVALTSAPVATADAAQHERLRPRTSEITLQSRRLGDFEAGRRVPTCSPPTGCSIPPTRYDRSRTERGSTSSTRCRDVGSTSATASAHVRARLSTGASPHRCTGEQSSSPSSRERAASEKPRSRRCWAWRLRTPVRTG